jgi:peroxiredoxin
MATFSRLKLLSQRHLLLAMLTASVAVNIALAARLNGKLRLPGPRPIAVGVPFDATDPNGAVTKVAYDGNLPTILYWFSPTCSWCERNFQNFEALAAQAPGRYRFLAVSAASPGQLAAYADHHHTKAALYSISRDTARSYRLSGTPTTMELSSTGKVLNIWSGAYDATKLKQLQTTMLITLSGTVQIPKHRSP